MNGSFYRCVIRFFVRSGVCNNVANVNRPAVAFATMLQASTEPPWYLQQCCKRQPTRRGFCNNVASVNRPAVVFATTLQTSTESPWYLQQCCKHQPTRRGLCNNVASVNRPAVAFAGTLQTSTEPPWPLQERCKRQPNRRGLCRNAANVNLIIHDPLPPLSNHRGSPLTNSEIVPNRSPRRWSISTSRSKRSTAARPLFRVTKRGSPSMACNGMNSQGWK